MFGQKSKRYVRTPGQPFDTTDLHGKWCTITMIGQDTGYARVGVISSNDDYILFQFRDKKGIAAKQYIKYIDEVPMNERKLKKEQELVVEEWDESKNPFERFIGCRCDIHTHQTRMFEATPGFFHARIIYVGVGIVRIQENSKEFNVKQPMICGMMETQF